MWKTLSFLQEYSNEQKKQSLLQILHYEVTDEKKINTEYKLALWKQVKKVRGWNGLIHIAWPDEASLRDIWIKTSIKWGQKPWEYLGRKCSGHYNRIVSICLVWSTRPVCGGNSEKESQQYKMRSEKQIGARSRRALLDLARIWILFW